jgi:hypothetical protein
VLNYFKFFLLRICADDIIGGFFFRQYLVNPVIVIHSVLTPFNLGMKWLESNTYFKPLLACGGGLAFRQAPTRHPTRKSQSFATDFALKCHTR